jgi:hypothetical protein
VWRQTPCGFLPLIRQHGSSSEVQGKPLQQFNTIHSHVQRVQTKEEALILILDFQRGMNIDSWFWGFCTVSEVNFPTTFRKPLWVPSLLVMSQNDYFGNRCGWLLQWSWVRM